jgi:hypothetical protein
VSTRQGLENTSRGLLGAERDSCAASLLARNVPGLLGKSDLPQEPELKEKTAGLARLEKNAVAFFPLFHSFGCC